MKTMEHEEDGDTNCNRWAQNDLQMLSKGTGRLGNQTSGFHPDYSNFLDQAECWNEARRLEETYCERLSAYAGVKNSQGVTLGYVQATFERHLLGRRILATSIYYINDAANFYTN